MTRAQSIAMAIPHRPGTRVVTYPQGRTPRSSGSWALQCLCCCYTQRGVQTAPLTCCAIVQGSEKCFGLTQGLGGRHQPCFSVPKRSRFWARGLH